MIYFYIWVAFHCNYVNPDLTIQLQILCAVITFLFLKSNLRLQPNDLTPGVDRLPRNDFICKDCYYNPVQNG